MGRPPGHRLGASDRPLCDRYDTAIFDLDGVVYVGQHAVAGAPERMTRARGAGMHLAFVTNNASRPPAAVAQHLHELGVPAEAGDVVTSAQAAARMLKGLVSDGAAVLVVGGEGLVEALAEHGLRAVSSVDEGAAAVVQGFGSGVGWTALAEAVVAVDKGLPWVASNLDATLPTPRGRAPGNGQLVEVVARTTGLRPLVAGKPERPLFEETLLRVGGERPLVIGDRLDTDIEGAVRCGFDSLLVMTGVTDLAQLAAAPRGSRPTYVSHDLEGLFVEHPGVAETDGVSTCGGWSARMGASDAEQTVELSGSGQPDDALRALVATCWSHQDRRGHPVEAAAVDAVWRSAQP